MVGLPVLIFCSKFVFSLGSPPALSNKNKYAADREIRFFYLSFFLFFLSRFPPPSPSYGDVIGLFYFFFDSDFDFVFVRSENNSSRSFFVKIWFLLVSFFFSPGYRCRIGKKKTTERQEKIIKKKNIDKNRNITCSCLFVLFLFFYFFH